MPTRTQQLILMHEIGHVLGLDHVNDQRQLMNAGYVGQETLGKGDIAGLQALHAVPCD
jgi:predicted Zn-dependent protease